jgi:hypothetical protein
MFSFFKNVDKSREEWLKSPRPIPKRAMYLNALAKAEAEAKSKATQSSISTAK